MRILSAEVSMQSMEEVVSRSISEAASSCINNTILGAAVQGHLDHSLRLLMESYVVRRYVNSYEITFSFDNGRPTLTLYFSITPLKTFCFQYALE